MENNRENHQNQEEIFSYQYDYLKPEQQEEPSEEQHVEKKSSVRILTIIQILACLIVLAGCVILKTLGGPWYDFVKDWYWDHLNQSIIAKGETNFQEAWNQIISPGEESSEQESEQDNQSIIPQSGNAMFTHSMNSPFPVTLTVYLTPPVKEGVVTSLFGTRDGDFHRGLDIGTNLGSDVVASLPGTIEQAENNSSYGNYLVINHGNNIKTLYAHCSLLSVEKGEFVMPGEKIAETGSTGDSTGPHLHFELLINGVEYDPETVLKKEY